MRNASLIELEIKFTEKEKELLDIALPWMAEGSDFKNLERARGKAVIEFIWVVITSHKRNFDCEKGRCAICDWLNENGDIRYLK